VLFAGEAFSPDNNVYSIARIAQEPAILMADAVGTWVDLHWTCGAAMLEETMRVNGYQVRIGALREKVAGH
jgi:hypothetical protein